MGFYIKCPFFLHQQHKRPTISCEDCIRLFDSNEEKFGWIKRYCEDAWEQCEYAAGMIEIYERTMNMNENESKAYVAEKELEKCRDNNKRLLSYIGRKNKHIEKLEAELAKKNEIAKHNNELYRMELEQMRTRAENLEKQKNWAESILGAVLIKANKMSNLVKLDLKELGELMVKYQLRFTMDEDEHIAWAKIEEREEVKGEL